VEQEEAANPADVGALGSPGVVARPNGLSELVEQSWFRGCGGTARWEL